MFKKSIDNIKSSFGRGAAFVQKQIQNLPKYIQKGQAVSKSIRDTAENASNIASKVKSIADKNDIVPTKIKGKVDNAFKKGYKAVEDIQKADDKFGKVSNDILASGIF